MLDIKYIRENTDKVKVSASAKKVAVDIDRLLEVDVERRSLIQEVEQFKAQKNEASKKIATLDGEEKQAAIAEMKAVGEKQDAIEDKLQKVMDEYNDLMLRVPTVISEDTPIGKDDTENVERKKVGDIPTFDFPVKDHVQLGNELDILSLEKGANVAGSRSYFLKGDGARLEQAVIKYAQDFISRKGYSLMVVPVVINPDVLQGAGFIPGHEEEIYYLEKDNKYLVGTSEASIAGYHQGEMLKEAELPLKYAGVSSCFRREAGSYGKDTHGLYRVHQFNKVEQYEELLSNAEELLASLGIPYRIVTACSGDLGMKTAFMEDIEAWMPSRDSYGETHSCSIVNDFQARRLNIRYKDAEGNVNYCYTLNNTVIATPRILIPIMELNQQADGSIKIPEVLRPYMDNQEVISNSK
jgi:seryl-tRNA synthetase